MALTDRGGAQIGAPQRGKESSTRAARGRICTREGCATMLSTYNRATECSIHTEPSFRHALYHS